MPAFGNKGNSRHACLLRTETLGRGTPKNDRKAYFRRWRAGGAQLLARSRGLINPSSSGFSPFDEGGDDELNINPPTPCQ